MERVEEYNKLTKTAGTARRRGNYDVNSVTLEGRLVSGYTYGHSVGGEDFYTFSVRVPRLSGSHDILPVTAAERLIERKRVAEGAEVYVNGQIRTYNRVMPEAGQKRLVLMVFAHEYGLLETDGEGDHNEVYLNGRLCKPPNCRVTPLGRTITDLLVAINRPHNKSDYIPCITWGSVAGYASGLNTGDRLRLWGRLQSRAYEKDAGNGEIVTRVAYEVSAAKLEKVSAIQRLSE